MGKNKKTKNVNYLSDEDYYYFVHSYYCEPSNKNSILSYTNYQGFNYCSSVYTNNIFATQFHPEKSGKSGLKILNNIKEVYMTLKAFYGLRKSFYLQKELNFKSET